MDLERIAGVELAVVDEEAVENELREYVGGHGGAVSHGVREPWAITSLGAADWCLRRLADCRDAVQRYDDEIALWTRARRQIVTAGDWFEARLKEWGIEQRTPQRKSFPLAHGTVATRESRERIMVVDEAAALAWADEHDPDAIKTVRSFLVSQTSAKIERLIVAFESTDTTTGEREVIEIEPSRLDEGKLAALRAKLDGHVVEPLTEPFVVDDEGVPVPGLDVQPSSISVSVTPLGL